MRTSSATAALVVGLALVSGACGSDDGESGVSDTTTAVTAGEPAVSDTTTAVTAGEPADLSSYDDITALHQQLVDQGVACGLEYRGLRDEGREVSLCVIEGEQALLTVWDDPALVTEFAGSEAAETGDVAYGRNWTVDVDSPEAAEQVAAALGGTVSG